MNFKSKRSANVMTQLKYSLIYENATVIAYNKILNLKEKNIFF